MAFGGTAQKGKDRRSNDLRSLDDVYPWGWTRHTIATLEFLHPSNRFVRPSHQVTHCGMGGLYECAANGVPIIPLPFSLSADQPVNAAIAEAAGFAVRPRPSSNSGVAWLKFWERFRTSQYTPGALRDAVAKVLEDPAFAEGAKRAKRAALAAGYGRVAVDAVEST